MYEIYVHTNRSNGMRYVGYTHKSMEKRWKEHVEAAHSGKRNLLARAIRKHGLEAFDHDIICECESASDAKNLERHFIEMLNTKGPLGYNMTFGGDGFVGLQRTKEHIKNQANSHRGKGSSLKGRTYPLDHSVRAKESEQERFHKSLAVKRRWEADGDLRLACLRRRVLNMKENGELCIN